MKNLNITDIVNARRSIKTAVNVGFLLSISIVIPTIVTFFYDSNRLVFFQLLLMCFLFFLTLFFVNKGNKIAIIILDLFVLCLCVSMIVYSSNHNTEYNVIRLKKSLNPNYKPSEELPRWLFILFSLFIILPFYKATKAIFCFSDSLKNYKNLKKGKIHISYNGKNNTSIIIAISLLLISYLLYFVSLLTLFSSSILGFIGFSIFNVIGIIVSIICIYFAKKFIVSSKKNIADKIYELRKKDNRSPILLIRSFSDDNIKLNKGGGFSLLKNLSPSLTLEESLVIGLSYFSPVIAIANPKEKLFHLGAAKEKYQGEEWKSKIEEFIIESKYIIAILNDTNGLEFELEKIIELGHLNKLLLFIPPVDKEELLRRWKKINVNLNSNYDINSIDEKTILLKFNSSNIDYSVNCRDKKSDSYLIAIRSIEIF